MGGYEKKIYCFFFFFYLFSSHRMPILKSSVIFYGQMKICRRHHLMQVWMVPLLQFIL